MNIILGLIHVYTGEGKGKTSTSLGLTLRAVGNGYSVYIIQFLKSGDTGELFAVQKYLPNVTIAQYGIEAITDKQSKIFEFAPNNNQELRTTGRFKFLPDEKEREACRRALEQAKHIINSDSVNIVILDEINCAMQKGLIPITEVIEMLKNKPEHVEVILTGRGAPKEIIEIANYATYLQEVKHPWQQKINARRGIEY